MDFSGNEHDRNTAVIISTRGRPDVVHALVRELPNQSNPPDHVFVIGSSVDDVARLDQQQPNLTIHIGRPGSSHQRNDGLTLAGSRFAYIVFFDDDFVPSRLWLERMADIFASRPDVVGITGTILADGSASAGIPWQDARTTVELCDANPPQSWTLPENIPYGRNMGCNMAFRSSALRDIRFDERLPLYAWLEDHDVRGQLAPLGPVVRAPALWGVHLGHKQGRVPGVLLGYSQIANAIYLAKKGTVPKGYLTKLACKNLLMNAARSVSPEPFIDRRGRLRGNAIALADLVCGRIAPERVLEIQRKNQPPGGAAARQPLAG